MHSIRLQHPWKCCPQGNGFCWSRAFHWPAGERPKEKTRLVVAELPVSAVVSLNERPLAADGAGHFDITSLLGPDNRITIELAGRAPASQTEFPFEVRLEIFEA
ncbi:MAG: hypothetical protein MK171_09740 [Pirellulales bacterium]|nr:hypothetical protein [Pirellulales bacterium]